MKIGLSNWFCSCNLVRFLCILFWVQTLWAGKIEHQRTHHSYSLIQIAGTKIPYLDLPKEKRKSVLEKSSGVLYRKSIFSRDELAVIQKEVSTCMSELQEECSSSIAQKRSVATLSTNGEAVNILKYGSLHRLIERVTGKTCELATKVPVEIRVYERPGAGMAWHVDDVLYDPPQVEIVLTLENNSDCKTMWISGTGDNEITNCMETEPNSAILLVAGMAPHCVTHLKYGRRVILKFAYIEMGATFNEGEHEDQFDKQSRGKQRRKTKRRQP